MKHPIYFALGLMSCAYLLTANVRGWSFWKSLTPGRSGSSTSGFHHK